MNRNGIGNVTRKIETAWDLRRAHEETHPGSHWFSDNNLRCFGESMSTMRVLKGTATIKDVFGNEHTCYVLSKMSRKHPCGPRRTYAYFDVETFDDIGRF